MNKDKIFVIGHKAPDLDSVAAAIAYANLKNTLENSLNYTPVAAGQLNEETKYVLKKFNYQDIGLLDTAKDKKIILVDHNEFIQAVDGIEEATIVEVLDHHQLNFHYREPISVLVRPWGSSCSIIAQLFLETEIEINKDLAGIMLSAVLVDTVITKSPTCTEYDKAIIEKLAEIAEIENWRDFGMELFKIRSSVNKLTPAEIVKSDFKDFEVKGGKFGIGQVETVDPTEFEQLEEPILLALENLKKEGGYNTTILFITDILKEGSLFLVASDDLEKLETALGKKIVDNRVYLEKIISRKKQVAPMITKIFDK